MAVLSDSKHSFIVNNEATKNSVIKSDCYNMKEYALHSGKYVYLCEDEIDTKACHLCSVFFLLLSVCVTYFCDFFKVI